MTNNMARWKEIQASMATEGYEVSDSMLTEIAKEYERAEGDAELVKLLGTSKAGTRPLLEVLRDHFEEKKKRDT